MTIHWQFQFPTHMNISRTPLPFRFWTFIGKHSSFFHALSFTLSHERVLLPRVPVTKSMIRIIYGRSLRGRTEGVLVQSSCFVCVCRPRFQYLPTDMMILIGEFVYCGSNQDRRELEIVCRSIVHGMSCFYLVEWHFYYHVSVKMPSLQRSLVFAEQEV